MLLSLREVFVNSSFVYIMAFVVIGMYDNQCDCVYFYQKHTFECGNKLFHKLNTVVTVLCPGRQITLFVFYFFLFVVN